MLQRETLRFFQSDDLYKKAEQDTASVAACVNFFFKDTVAMTRVAATIKNFVVSS